MDRERALRACLEAFPEVRLAVLFGSEATGAAHALSDVDVGLRLAGAPSPTAALEAALARAAGRAVDLVLLDAAPPLLRFEIARDGHLLTERDPHAWADFKARAMVDWWDWAPTAHSLNALAARRLREEIARGPA